MPMQKLPSGDDVDHPDVIQGRVLKGTLYLLALTITLYQFQITIPNRFAQS